jgi:hypothetical protein
MKHTIISMEIGMVQPLVGMNPATGVAYPALEEQKGNAAYKNGTVGRYFLLSKSMPTLDVNNLSIISIGKTHTELCFLSDDKQYSFFTKLIENALASPQGWETANGGKPYAVEKQYFDVPTAPFYWIDPVTKERRVDKNGQLSPIIKTVRVMSSIVDGKPAIDINAEALRMIKDFGRFVQVDAQEESIYSPPISGEQQEASLLGGINAPTVAAPPAAGATAPVIP